ncbi:unnamed protein product [Peniophora sp. CBMAI 1063]|nr:unnamed protein product [Peniophora sp. CBMAI 1063]
MQSPASESSFSVPQNIITRSGQGSDLLVRTVHEHFLTSGHIKDLVSTISPTRDGLPDALGVAPVFVHPPSQQLSKYAPRDLHRGAERKLHALVFATSTTALVIFLDPSLKGSDTTGRVNLKGKKGKDKTRGRVLLRNLLLSQDTPPIERKFAIDADALTGSVYANLGLRVAHLADVSSVSAAPSQSHGRDIFSRVLAHLRANMANQDVDPKALQSALTNETQVQQLTMDHPVIRRAVLQAWLARAIAVRAGQTEALGHVRVVDNTATSEKELDALSRIFHEGQQDGSGAAAGSLRMKIISNALVDPSSLYSIVLFRAIFSPDAPVHIKTDDFWRAAPALPPSAIVENVSNVDDAQTNIVRRALDENDTNRILLVHGSAGTGKTTTIAALCAAAAATRSIWVLTPSDVVAWAAASRLLSSGFRGFRLLSGGNARYEALYPGLKPYRLTADECSTSSDVELLTSDGVRVIICALASVTDRQLRQLKKALPVQTVVVDGADQIDLNDYIPLIHGHSSTLARLVFVGDMEQQPSRDAPSVRSIFDVAHFQEVLKLDVQYRMPHTISDFLSRHGYNDSIVHSPHNTSEPWLVCRFVDVPPKAATANSKKKSRSGDTEAPRRLPHDEEAVIIAAERYSREGLNFRIVADSERTRDILAEKLKEAGLSPFLCVTMQDLNGGEADHIIVFLGSDAGTTINSISKPRRGPPRYLRDSQRIVGQKHGLRDRTSCSRHGRLCKSEQWHMHMACLRRSLI